MPDLTETEIAERHNIQGAKFSLIEAKQRGVSLRYKNARLKDAGEHLRRLKHSRTKAEFEALLRQIGVSTSRAYDLMKLKDQNSLDNLRSATAQRVARYRQKAKNS